MVWRAGGEQPRRVGMWMVRWAAGSCGMLAGSCGMLAGSCGMPAQGGAGMRRHASNEAACQHEGRDETEGEAMSRQPERTARLLGRVQALAMLLVATALAMMVGCTGVTGSVETGAAPGAGASEDARGQYAAAEGASVSLGESAVSADDVPAYAGPDVLVINDNEPSFTADELARGAFELYSPLDALGRCGAAFACVGKETMPTEGRGNISGIHPSGWRQRTYDFIPEDGKLYNRSHLIAHALAGEDDNELNLITGTRHFNQDVMVNYENEILSYVRKTKNHVLYRVTPVFADDELVARGVQMEARSVEDNGRGINFNVFVYNVQPGVRIDYATGESWPA